IPGEDLAPAMDPDPLAGFCLNAMLALVLTGVAAEILVQDSLDARAILRMQPRKELIEMRRELAGAIPAHFRPSVIEDDVAGLDVPVPRRQLGTAEREVETFLRLTKPLLVRGALGVDPSQVTRDAQDEDASSQHRDDHDEESPDSNAVQADVRADGNRPRASRKQ